jgi:hypothetical protein
LKEHTGEKTLLIRQSLIDRKGKLLDKTRQRLVQYFRNNRPRIIRRWLEIILAVVILWFVLIQVSRSLCRQAIARLAEQTNTRITADTFSVKLGGKIVLKGLTVKNKDNREILRAGTLRTDLSWSSLLLFHPRLKRIILSDFTIILQYDTDKKIWNISGLKGIGGGKGQMPLIRLNKGRLLYSKILNGKEKTAADVNFTAIISPKDEGQPQKNKNAICFFDITADKWIDFGQTRLTGSVEPGMVMAEGRIRQIEKRNELITAQNLSVLFDFKDNWDYSLKLNIKRMTSAKKSIEEGFINFRFLFPEQIGAFEILQDVFDRFKPGGQIDLDIDFWGNLKQLNDNKLLGNVLCRDVWVRDENFRYAIENLKGRIDVTERSAVLQKLTGRHGQVELQIDGWTNKRTEGQEFQFRITSENMLLDKDLYNALSDSQKKFWDDFSPKGKAAINQFIARKSTKEKTSVLKVRLLNNQAQWRIFPYPLNNLTGQMTFDSNQILFSNVASQSSEDEKIIVNGRVSGYEAPRPLYDIEIKGENVKSEFIKEDKYQDSLSKLLSEYFLKLVSELKFSGTTNFLAHFNNSRNREKTEFRIELDCLGDKVEHTKYAYPVNDLRGKITVDNESIRFKDVSGRLAGNIPITEQSSKIKVNGLIKTAENKFSQANIRLEVNDMSFDERLRLILPESTREMYSSIQPTGLFDIDFNDLKITAAGNGEQYSDFNSVLTLKGCNFMMTMPVTEFSGPLRIKGLYKSGYGFVEGRTNLEGCDLQIEDEKFSDIHAGIFYDVSNDMWRSDDLTAICYDGKVTGRLQFEKQKNNKSAYLLDVGFFGIDLKKFLEDSIAGRKETQEASQAKKAEHHNGLTGGNMNGSLSIRGTMGDENDRIGICRLYITDMQAGKLSIIGKLLYILNLTEPRDFAFDQMLVDSYIQSNRIILKKVDFSGKALAFNGAGELNLKNFDIDLLLTARGQRLAGASPGVLQSLGEGIGRGIVQVDIKNSIFEPQIKVRALPVIEDTLSLLGTKEKK